jgi:hypothetical protein
MALRATFDRRADENTRNHFFDVINPNVSFVFFRVVEKCPDDELGDPQILRYTSDHVFRNIYVAVSFTWRAATWRHLFCFYLIPTQQC